MMVTAHSEMRLDADFGYLLINLTQKINYIFFSCSNLQYNYIKKYFSIVL